MTSQQIGNVKAGVGKKKHESQEKQGCAVLQVYEIWIYRIDRWTSDQEGQRHQVLRLKSVVEVGDRI